MNLQNLDLNLLKIFNTLYIEKSLTRVAKIMFLSQPAISHSLAKLRDFFDDPLFVREKNIMVPTIRAHKLHKTINKSLKLLQKVIEDKGSEDPALSSRTFVLGLSNYSSVIVLPELLRELEQKAPHIRIETRHATLDQKAAYLEDGSVDLVLSFSELKNSGIKQQRLFDDQEVCIAGRQTRIPEKMITLDNIGEYSLIRLKVSEHESTDIFQFLDKNKIRLKSTFSTDQEFIIPQVVARTCHIGIIAERIAKKYQAAFEFNIYPAKGMSTQFTIRQYWHLRHDKDPAHAWFRAVVKDVCDKSIDNANL